MNRLEQLRALPNQLTLLRLFVIPWIVIAMLDGHQVTAFILLLVAGISDALDGRLARWLHKSTVLGQYLDPIADKLLLSTLFLVLMHMRMIPTYVAVLVFSRDFGILLIAALLYMTMGLRDFRPGSFGKLNTAAQIITVVLVMLCNIVPASWINFVSSVRDIMLLATAALTVLSALQYIFIAGRRINPPASNDVPPTASR
jgi:cardiolipin synthase (CMP-forming)